MKHVQGSFTLCCSHRSTGASFTSADTAWFDQRDRLRESSKKGEREIRYRHAQHTMRLAFTSNRQPDSLMCPVYSNYTAPIHSTWKMYNEYNLMVNNQTLYKHNLFPMVCDVIIARLKRLYIWQCHNVHHRTHAIFFNGIILNVF